MPERREKEKKGRKGGIRSLVVSLAFPYEEKVIFITKIIFF